MTSSSVSPYIPRINSLSQLSSNKPNKKKPKLLGDLKQLTEYNYKINIFTNSIKTTDTDNTVKLSKAETDAKKEENRHSEEMAKIDREWKKISDEAADRERRLSFIQGQIQKFQAEYDKYMAMETEDFLSDTVTARLESLRKVIMELTKELNRA